MIKVEQDFFKRDVLSVAPDLLGKYIVVGDNKLNSQFMITEVEAYRGEEDLACHASKGRTPRTEMMYDEGGKVYVYLIYGMYWMLNFVTGAIDQPQAVLIRGVEGCNGPGRLGRLLKLDKSYYGENVSTSKRIWLNDNGLNVKYVASPRIGINYAGEYWKAIEWRFEVSEVMQDTSTNFL